MSLALAPAAAVAERVRERLRAERMDPARDPEFATQITRAEVRRHNDFALARGLALVDDEAACVREVLAAVAGYGPLQAYLDDPTVEELCINASDRGLQVMTCCGIQPTCAECGVVMRDEPGGVRCPACGDWLPSDDVTTPPAFDGPSIRGG